MTATRTVKFENGKLVSENREEVNMSEKEGGKMSKYTRLEMDANEARRQIKWIQEGYERAKAEYDRHKHNLTHEGIENLKYLERQQMQTAEEEMNKLKDLKEQYEKAMSAWK